MKQKNLSVECRLPVEKTRLCSTLSAAVSLERQSRSDSKPMFCNYCRAMNPNDSVYCSACGQTIRVPVERIELKGSSEATSTPASGNDSASNAENKEYERTRTARTESMPRDGDLFRNGRDLHVRRGARLPTICIKCGRPATGLIKKKIYWHPSWLLALLLLGLWPYFIAVLVMRKNMDLTLPLCETHRKRHRLFQILSWAALVGLGLVVLSFYSSADQAPAIAGIGALFVLSGLIFLALTNKPLTATSIGDEFGVFRGAAATFLERIPPKPNSSPPMLAQRVRR